MKLKKNETNRQLTLRGLKAELLVIQSDKSVASIRALMTPSLKKAIRQIESMSDAEYAIAVAIMEAQFSLSALLDTTVDSDEMYTWMAAFPFNHAISKEQARFNRHILRLIKNEKTKAA